MSPTDLAEQAQRGDVDALKAFVELKLMLQELEQAMKVVQPLAIAEADKYHEKSFEFMGAIIEKRNAPCTWDYSGIEAWKSAKKKLAYVESIAKAGGGYDNETTEEIGAAFRVEGKSTIAVKFPA